VEGVVERTAGPFQLTLSAYASRIRDLIDLVTADSLGLTRFVNRAMVHARGLEGEIQCVRADGLRVRMAAALQRSTDNATGQELSNSPRWNAHLVVTRAPVESRWSLGAGLRLLSPRVTLAGKHTDPAVVLDTRLGLSIARQVEVGLEAKNLADVRYGDPASRELPEDQILQAPRAFYLTLAYHTGYVR
jgi:outer membrane receptor protein involved in Fe transport